MIAGTRDRVVSYLIYAGAVFCLGLSLYDHLWLHTH